MGSRGALKISQGDDGSGSTTTVVIILLLLFSGLGCAWFGRKRGWFDTVKGWLVGWMTTLKQQQRTGGPVVHVHRGGDASSSMAAPLSMNVMPTGTYAPPMAPLQSEEASFSVTVAAQPLQTPAVGGTPLPPLALPSEPLPEGSI